MKIIVLGSHPTRQPTMLNLSEMANYKRKNIKGHVRRKTANGYWIPKRLRK